MSCHTVIQKLEADNSRLAKEAIVLKEAEAGNIEFFDGVKLALDALVTFGVKKVPIHGGPDGQGLPWNVFLDLATKLQRRELTGNDAKKAVELTMSVATQAEWNDWYRRILIKDLRCGVSEKTINNVVKKKHTQYSVPVFTCQLAHDSANHETKVSGKKYIEVKLDGVRVLTIVYPSGRVDQFSRNGKELVNFPHIVEQISKVASQFTEPMVLDGEVMSSSFQDLMKQVHRKSDVQSQDAVLHLFDILTLKDFNAGKSKVRQEDRSKQVYDWHKANKTVLPNVAVVGHELVDLDSPEGKRRFKEINQFAIDGGYEGIMIKDPNAPYELKRSTAWLKLKPFIEVSLTVAAVEEGTGRNVRKLGALVCEGDDDGKFIRVNVGSGFTDTDRDEFWKYRDNLIDQVVEVRADAITQNQDGSYSLRFPRFLRFRGFVPGEKI
jgi:DNA ligase 1